MRDEGRGRKNQDFHFLLYSNPQGCLRSKREKRYCIYGTFLTFISILFNLYKGAVQETSGYDGGALIVLLTPQCPIIILNLRPSTLSFFPCIGYWFQKPRTGFHEAIQCQSRSNPNTNQTAISLMPGCLMKPGPGDNVFLMKSQFICIFDMCDGT